jgi:two-component system chemotaxis response regulator CheY
MEMEMEMANKIMVVDDSAMVRQQVSRVLVAAGFSVVEAADGEDALAKLRTDTGVALVLCDVNMPRMNGIEFLERVDPRCRVVMLTTEGQPAKMQQAKSLGAMGWILKPFKPELLVATVKKLTAGR